MVDAADSPYTHAMDFANTVQRSFGGEIFERVSLAGGRIEEKEFEKCVFRKCSFLECAFVDCRFVDCRFEGSMLSAVRFDASSFLETAFADSKVIGIDWTKANKLRGAAFLRSDVSQCNFSEMKLPGLAMRDCTAKEAVFSSADCTGADFGGTDFERTLFHKTNLTGAAFVGAYHYTIDFRSNLLKKTIFSLPEAVSLLRSLDIVLQ